MKRNHHLISLGESEISVAQLIGDNKPVTFLNLHNNEQDAVRVGLNMVESYGGNLLYIDHELKREVSFQLADEVYSFDPNRIFTDRGIIGYCGVKDASEEVVEVIRLFRKKLLSLIPEGNGIVALHNNHEYTIELFLGGGSLSGEAKEVYYKEGSNSHNFFLVTQFNDYASLLRAGQNVVLQHPHRVVDDGSLSVYCAQEGIRYVNCEAGHGEYDAQHAMLQSLLPLL